MELTITSIRAGKTELVVYSRHMQRWVSYPQIAGALGMSLHGIQSIFDRHRDLFTEDMTALIPLPTAGGMQETRVFSFEGAILIARFAKTKEAIQIHMDLVAELGKASRRPVGKPVQAAVPTRLAAIVRQIASWPETPEPMRERLARSIETGEDFATMPELTGMAERRLAAAELAGQAAQTVNRIDREAAQLGYSRDEMKAEMVRLKRARHAGQGEQRALAFAEEPADA